MTRPSTLQIPEVAEDAVDQLVAGFSEPLAFLRELAQNAIDAGSGELEITCTFEPDGPELPPGCGTAVIRVVDFGEGMDRHILHAYLTHVFSSEKESDRTKIGKFGFGFISVFAFQPDAVCVDTGRYGESWRIVFRPDRSYTLALLPEPVEGTTVRLFKTMTREEFDDLEEQVRHAVHRYCQHIELTLHYQGELVRGPLSQLAVRWPLKIITREHDATLVVGLSPDGEPDSASFLNRGLLLLSRPSDLPGISYMISSPHFEPTQGRDNIVQDEHYHALLSSVYRLAGGALIEQLSTRLEQALQHEGADDECGTLQRCLAKLIHWNFSVPPSCQGRAVARSPHGHMYPLQALKAAAQGGIAFLVAHPSPLSAAACRSGLLVVEDAQAELLTALYGGPPPRLERERVLPLRMKASDPAVSRQAAILCDTAHAFLRATASPFDAVELGLLDYPGSGSTSLPGVAQADPFTATGRESSLLHNVRWDGPRGTLIVNADHPVVKTLLPLAETDPELAAYSLLKLCFFRGALTSELDSKLVALALSERLRQKEMIR